MSDLVTDITYLADLPLYQKQKPYYIYWPAGGKRNMTGPTTNVEFQVYHDIKIADIRALHEPVSLESTGFQILDHVSNVSLPITTPQDVEKYRKETEDMLRSKLGAVEVFCYESTIRKNEPVLALTLDFDDPLSVERPADGPHIDATKDSGPRIVQEHLPDKMKTLLGPGTRVRIINTWRSMLPVVEDCPLAFIDYRTVNKLDLIASDRVTPSVVGEVYYVRFNPQQRWYWLASMKSNEPAMFLTYDSNPGHGARFCAHVSVPNPRARAEAPPRHSIETRSIVITRI